MKTSDISPELKRKITHAVNLRLSRQEGNPIDEAVIIAPRNTRLADREHFEFALGACQYPAGLLDADLAYDSYSRLALKIEENTSSPDALILTGDQIYADATAGLFDPAQLDDNYRRSYERWLQKNPVGEVMRQIPVITMLDDHEILNNYEPINAGFFPDKEKERKKNYEHAIKYFLKYQRSAGPYPDNIIKAPSDKQLWCSLEQAGLPVFLANSRTEREHRHAGNIHKARIMSEAQYSELKTWLIKPEMKDLPKLVVTPSILLPRHSRLKSSPLAGKNDELANALLSDSWDGFPASLHDLLIFIAKNKIRNVVFLSGDEHLGCACRAQLKSTDNDEEVIVHSIHTSALYAPYPFANGRPAKLMTDECFDLYSDFTDGSSAASYTCEVDASIYPGSGFTLINLTSNNQGTWEITCEFNRSTEQETGFYSSKLS